MAVYTKIDRQLLELFLEHYELGNLINFIQQKTTIKTTIKNSLLII